MAYETFQLVVNGDEREVELPASAPAPVVSKTREILYGGANADMQGDSIGATIDDASQVEKARRHLVKGVVDMYCDGFDWDALDGDSYNKLLRHYWDRDVAGKNSNKSGDEQNSSAK